MADGQIIIDTKIDSSGAEKGVSQLNKIASAGLKGVGAVVAGVTTAVGGLSVAAIKVGSDFEEGMSKVQAISGATGKELEELTEKAKEMGAKTKFSAGESAQAFQYMAMAGWKTGDMINGIEGIMNLAAASGEDLAMVSDIVTDALTAFGLQAKDSAHFADVLAKASSNSNTNVGLMGYTFQYVAPVAGALGYSIEDCAVAIGLMANAGIKGEKSGTALRTLFTNLISPTDTVAGAMKRLGIEAVNADGTMKPLNQLLLEMRGSFAGLTDEEKASEAAALAGKEAMSGLLAIVNASDEDFNNLTAAIADSNGAAEEMATIMQDNLSGKLEQLGGGLETLGLTAYEKFKGPMKDAIDTAIEAVDSLVGSLNEGELGESVDRIAEGFGNLVESIAEGVGNWFPKILDCLVWIMDNGNTIATALISIGTAILTIKAGMAIMGLVNTIKNLGSVSSIISTAITALGGPITIIIGLVAGLIAGIVYLWNTNEGFREAVINCWNTILDAGKAVWEWLVKFFTEDIPNAWQSVVDFFSGIPDWFADLWDKVTEKFKEWGTNISNFFTELWNNVMETLRQWGENVSNFFTETIPQWIENITNWFGELPYKIGYALGELLGTVIKGWINIFNYLKENVPIWIDNVVNWFSELPGRIWTWLVNAYNNIVEWGRNTWDNFVETCTNIYTSVTDWFSKLPGVIWDWLVNTYNKVSNWGSNMYQKAAETASNFVNEIINWVKELPVRFNNWLSETINKIVNFASNAYSKAKEAGNNIVNGIVNTVKNLPSQIYDVGVNIVEGLWNGITSMGSWIKNKVSSFFTGIVDGAKAALGIHSPSRVFRDQVGKYMAQGVGVGFEDETDNVSNKMKSGFSSMVAKMNATVDYERSRSIPVSSIINYNTYDNKSPDNNTPIIIRNVNQTVLDGDIIAERTTDRVIENISDEQESYMLALGGI